MNRDLDPYCRAAHGDAVPATSIHDGRVENVIVRLDDGTRGGPTRDDVVITQEGCEYRPRVSAIVAGRSIVVKNADQTLHNVHTYPPDGARPFNRAQVPGSPPFDVSYRTHGAIVGIKCDVHPWMAAWVSVTNHGWFDVTNADGVFEILDVPAGVHTLEAWHERLGRKRAEIVIAPGTVLDVTISYDGTEPPQRAATIPRRQAP